MKLLQFVKGLSWLLVVNLLIKPVWIFLIDRQVQNVIGNEAYGSYFALLNLSYVLLFIADAGLSNYTTQKVAAGNGIAPKQLLTLKILLLTVYIAAVLLVGLLTRVSNWHLLSLLIGLQIAGSLLLFLRSLLAGNQLFQLDALFSVADKLLVTVIASIFLYGWLQPITVELYLLLQIGASLFVCAILLLVLLSKQFLVNRTKQRMKDILRQTAPFAAIILLMATHYRADGFLLERLNSAVQAGIYAAAYRLLDAANMIGYLAASFLVPFLARNQDDHHALKKTIRLCTYGLLAIGIPVSCFAIVFAPWIQFTLYYTKDPFNTQVLQLTLAVLPAYYFIHVYGSLLTATARFKTFISILVSSVVINLSINFFLIAGYGAIGSAIAAIISHYFCALACYLAACQQLGKILSNKTWIACLLGTIGILTLLFLLQAIIHSVWVILAVLLLLSGLVLVSQMRAIKIYVRSIIQ